MLSCNICNTRFSSNSLLYQHKINDHAPTVGIISSNLNGNQHRDAATITSSRVAKRQLSPNPFPDRSDKYRKISKHRNKRPQSELLDTNAKKRRKINPKTLKRKPSSSRHSSKRKKIIRRGTTSEYRVVPVSEVGSESDSLVDSHTGSETGSVADSETDSEADSRIDSRANLPDDSETDSVTVREIIPRGKKRARTGDIQGPKSKFRRILKKGKKRTYSDESSDARPSKYRRVAKYGVKRVRQSSSEDHPEKRRRIRDQTPDSEPQTGPTTSLRKRVRDDDSSDETLFRKIPRLESCEDELKRLEGDIKVWRRRYKNTSNRFAHFKDEKEEQIKTLEEQLKELEEVDGDYELNAISQSVINSVTIQDFNRIRTLIKNNQIGNVLRNRKLTVSLAKLFRGLCYGIIPITTSQRIALTEEDKQLIKSLKNASPTTIQAKIKQKRAEFVRLFSVIDESIKLVTKSYAKYGGL